ncbi:MAG: DUF222 domain-containing protein [Candidatus Nanopelagicales bacterium]
MDNGVRDAFALLQAGCADALDRAAAADAVKAWADAQQLHALQTLAQEQPAFLDDTGRLIDPATAEAAVALTWSTGSARERMDLASTLAEGLPEVLAALESGHIDLGKAREISLGTCELEPPVRTLLAPQAIGYARGHTRGQLRAWLARRVARIDPEAANRRHRRQAKKRCVRLLPESDGMATISAYLTAEEAQAVWASLRAAAATTEGSLNAVNADTFVGLLTGTRVGTPVSVTVLLTGTGDEIAGYGPISSGHAAKLCAGQPVVRLTAPKPSVGYRPAPALARWVRSQHRRCRFPGCRRPATQCDLDHVIPWPTGATHAGNLAPLCRYHHRLKTHGDWRVLPLPDGHLQWTSPRGRRYTTHLDDP